MMKTVRLAGASATITCIALAFAGCGKSQVPTSPAAPAQPPQPALKAAPETPIAEKKDELGSSKTWDPAWDAVIEKALPPDLLSNGAARAVHIYCPRFAEESEADKRAFWAYTFQALAGAEAGLNPTSDVHHLESAVDTIDPVTRRAARQEGLLQLKYQDSRRYDCNFDWQKDRTLPVKDPSRTILDPTNNLECGVKIMENQIITHHRPLVTPVSYWATLHPGTASYSVFRKQMANVPEACGIGIAKPRRTAHITHHATTHHAPAQPAPVQPAT